MTNGKMQALCQKSPRLLRSSSLPLGSLHKMARDDRTARHPTEVRPSRSCIHCTPGLGQVYAAIQATTDSVEEGRGKRHHQAGKAEGRAAAYYLCLRKTSALEHALGISLTYPPAPTNTQLVTWVHKSVPRTSSRPEGAIALQQDMSLCDQRSVRDYQAERPTTELGPSRPDQMLIQCTSQLGASIPAPSLRTPVSLPLPSSPEGPFPRLRGRPSRTDAHAT